MGSNKVAFSAIALACVMAAGTGGYFALRQNAAPDSRPISEAVPAVNTSAAREFEPAAVSSDKPVHETEAVVEPQEKAEAKPSKKPEPKAQKAQAPVSTASTARQVFSPSTGSSQPAPVSEPTASPIRTEPTERVVQDAPPPAPATPQHTFDELVVSTDSVIGLQSDTTVTSERARVEDRIEARVTRDVKVADRVAIPAGSRAIGYVTQVERGGKFKEQAKLSIRFQTIVLADGTRLPISTAPVEREGDTKTNSSAAKMGGGAVAGTILGAILGGGKGAAIGGAAGAGAGAAAVQAGDRSVATLRAGEPITIRLLSPVTVTSESK
jgi:hypothetical protein